MTNDTKPARDLTIGASEIAPALGLSPYKTQYRWWAERTGRLDRDAPSVAMELGTKLEPLILTTFVRDHDVDIIAGDAIPELFPTAQKRHTGWSVPHPTHKHLRASPDGLLRPSGMSRSFVEKFGVDVAGGEHVLVEAKTAGLATDNGIEARMRWGRAGTDAIPQGYLLQVVGSIETHNAELQRQGRGFMNKGVVRVLGAGLPLLDFVVVLVPALAAVVVDETRAVVNDYLIDDNAPPAMTLDDLDIERGLITRKHDGRKETRPATFDESVLWDAYAAAKVALDDAEHAARSLRNAIIVRVGEEYGWHDESNPKRKLLLAGSGEATAAPQPWKILEQTRELITKLSASPHEHDRAHAKTLQRIIDENTTPHGGTRAVQMYPRRKKKGEIE